MRGLPIWDCRMAGELRRVVLPVPEDMAMKRGLGWGFGFGIVLVSEAEGVDVEVGMRRGKHALNKRRGPSVLTV